MSDWTGIEELVAIADAGSFVGGARKLGRSSSHVSRAIAELESRLGAPVFFRTTRKISMTDTGRGLLDHFRRILEERDAAFTNADGKGEVHGELRVTCPTALGERFIAPIAIAYAARHPRLGIRLDLSNRVVDLVTEGFDLAIRTGHLPDSRLIGSRVAYRRLYTCASPAYLARRGIPQAVEDLENHTCLIGTSGTWHFRVDGRNRDYSPSGRWRSNSGVAVARAALTDLGICQLPEFYVQEHIARGELVPVLEDCRGADEPIWAVYPEKRHMMPRLQGLVEAIRRQLPAALAGRITPGARE